MRPEALCKIKGYVARDLELNHTNNDRRVVNVSVGYTPRRRDRDTGEWSNAGPTVWHRASFWDEDADRVLGLGIKQGSLVVMEGIPSINLYTDREQKTNAGIDLKFATIGLIAPPREERTAGQQPQSQGAWGAPQPSQQQGWDSPGSYSEDTPF